RQAVPRERDEDDGQDRLDDGAGHRRQEQQAQGDAEQGGQDQPPRTSEMDLVPIFQDDHDGDGDGDEDGKRGGDLDPEQDGEQGHADQGADEPERRPDQRGEEDHREYPDDQPTVGHPSPRFKGYRPGAPSASGGRRPRTAPARSRPSPRGRATRRPRGP